MQTGPSDVRPASNEQRPGATSSLPWAHVATRAGVTIAARGSALFGASMVVRLLGTSESGPFFLLIAAATVLAGVVAIGMPEAVSRSAANNEDGAYRATILGSALARSLSCTALTLVLVTVLVVLLDSVSRTLILAALMAGCIAAELIVSAWLRVIGRGPTAEIISASGPVLFAVSAVLASSVVVASGTEVAVWRAGLEAIGAALALVVVLRYLIKTGSSLPEVWRSRPHGSSALWMTGLCWLVLQQSDILLLGAIRGSNAVGEYAPILKTADLAAIPLGLLAAYTLPRAARLRKPRDVGILKSTYLESSRAAFVLASPVLVLMLVSPQAVLQVLFGVALDSTGVTISRVLIAAYWINGILGLNGATLEGVGNLSTLALRSLSGLVVGLFANIFLIASYGALGAAIGTLVAFTYLNALNSGILWLKHGVPPLDWTMTSAVLASLVSVVFLAVTTGAREPNVVTTAIWGACVFGAVGVVTTISTILMDRASRRALGG